MEPDMADKKLYEIESSTGVIYGHKLAVNSQGSWVMELKGTGAVIAVDKNLVKEVLPHTIGVRFFNSNSKTVYQYIADAGLASKGDLFVFESAYGLAIVQVVEVDTKSKSATVEFKPVAKLSVEKFVA